MRPRCGRVTAMWARKARWGAQACTEQAIPSMRQGTCQVVNANRSRRCSCTPRPNESQPHLPPHALQGLLKDMRSTSTTVRSQMRRRPPSACVATVHLLCLVVTKRQHVAKPKPLDCVDCHDQGCRLGHATVCTCVSLCRLTLLLPATALTRALSTKRD